MQFFQAAVKSILLCGCTTWMLTKHIEKKLDVNCTRMLWAVLNKHWRQHPTKQQLDGHQAPISKTIQIRQTRYVGHYWKSKDKLISKVLLWTPLHGWASIGRPARTYLQQFCIDTECSLEDLQGAMDNCDKRESGKSVPAACGDDDDIYVFTKQSLFLSCWTLTECLKKKLNGNYTRILHVILNKPEGIQPLTSHFINHPSKTSKA